MTINIREADGGKKTWVSMARHFNGFSNETVSDDVEAGG